MERKGITRVSIVLIIAIIVIGVGVGYWGITTLMGPEALTIGVVLYGYHDEGLWDPAAANAVLNLKDKYNLNITWVEGIDITQIESILRTVAQINKVVYLTTDEFAEACKTVAPEFPDVCWIQQYESEQITSNFFPSNVVAFNAYHANELSFWAGAIAANITETKKLGVIQAIPGPRDTRLMSAAFRAGAHYVDPAITVLRVVIGAYVDPVKTRDSVASFAEAGCDIVFIGMDDESGTLEAKDREICTLQEYMDITSSYPETLIGCTVWKWDVWLDKVLEAIEDGKFAEFRAQYYEMPLSLEDRSLDIPTFGNMVSDQTKLFANELREKILNGSVVVPLIDQW